MFIKLDGDHHKVVIKRKRIKNIYLKMADDYKIYISVPKHIRDSSIEHLLSLNKDKIKSWKEKIARKQKLRDGCFYLGEESNFLKLNIGDKNFNIEKWYKEQAKLIFNERLKVIHKNFIEDIPYPEVIIKSLKSKWGSCNRRKNSITLNLELIKRPLEIIDYVIVHELCHFIEPNHSSKFWARVQRYIPEYKSIRKKLRQDW